MLPVPSLVSRDSTVRTLRPSVPALSPRDIALDDDASSMFSFEPNRLWEARALGDGL